MEEFPRGVITEIELHNFMTYDHVIQKPGPKINFILGRNGSGKSSIVCAIALCCGSSPSFIGRGGTLTDFIKHGKPSASVQLTLSNPGGEPVVVRRVLRRSKANECYFNGRLVSMENYMEEIRALNIMTDNLVQFLPQERVIDFSLMSAIQLLENTEKTIGDVNLSKIHQELIAKGNQWEDAGAEVDRLRRALDEAKDKEAQLKHDVEALDVRQDIAVTMKLAAVKKDRLEIVEQQSALVKSKASLKKLNQDIHTAAEHVVPFEKKMAVGKGVSANATKCLLSAKKEIENYRARFDPDFFTTEPETLQRENATDLGTVKGSKARYEERLLKIKSLQTAKQNLETQQTDVDIPRLKTHVQTLQQQQMKIKTEIESTNGRKIRILSDRRILEEKIHNLISEINRLEHIDDGLTQYLRANDQTAFRAREWLKTNAGRLRGKVYGPVYAEIKLLSQDKRHADILGFVLPWDVKNMFICEEDADVDLLLTEMIGRENIKVPIKKMSRQSRLSLQDPEAFRQQVGCQTLVSELFEAPDVVYCFLLNRFRLANLPVFDQMLDTSRLEQLKRVIFQGGRLLMQLMFAGNSIFKFRTTRFSTTLASNSQPTPESRPMRELMTVQRKKPDVTPMLGQLDQLKIKIEDMKTAEQDIVQVAGAAQGQFSAISTEIQTSKTAISDAEKITNRIRAVVEETQRLEAQPFNYEEELARTASKIRERNMQSWKKLCSKGAGTATRVLEKTIDITLDYVKARTDIHCQSQDLKMKLRQLILFWEQYRQGATAHDRDMNRLKDILTQHLKLIREVPGSDITSAKLSVEALKQYSEMPSDIPQLDALHKSKRNQLNAAGEVNLNARRDLEKHIASTVKLENSIATHNEGIAKEKERFAKQRQKWMDTIQKLVSQIGASFSHFYRTMGLAGDVVLQRPDNPDHFEKYGYAIKVSYRPNRPLETLSGQVHSGGEKSVATALYMLAIQELTKCPFRVVDEINQGMDAENERRVFKMIVETASRCGGQYFILSPKLLPDLHLTGDVTVTVIFAGSEMHSGCDLDVWQLSNIARRLRLKNIPRTTASVPVVPEQSRSRKRPLEDADDEAATLRMVDSESASSRSKLRHRSKKLATLN